MGIQRYGRSTMFPGTPPSFVIVGNGSLLLFLCWASGAFGISKARRLSTILLSQPLKVTEHRMALCIDLESAVSSDVREMLS